jgi:hypothetical protein
MCRQAIMTPWGTMMLSRAPDDDDLDVVDLDALQRAMTIAARDPATAEQLKAKLEHEPWTAVAEFAAAHCQYAALGLRPWQSPPCRDDGEASAELLDDMLAAGISQWEPDPLKALAKAKRRRR